MWTKYFFIAAGLLLALVLQMGLFAHLAVFGGVPNLVFVIFFLVIFFEPANTYFEGILAVLMAGFLLDATGPLPFGPSLITLAVIYGVIKTIRHFVSDYDQSYFLFYFMPMFLISYFFYTTVFSALYYFPDFKLVFGLDLVAGEAYSLAFVLIGFYLYQKIHKKPDRQLKLFM
jgi:hypothetical protein